KERPRIGRRQRHRRRHLFRVGFRPVRRETQIHGLGRRHVGDGGDDRGRWLWSKALARIETRSQTAEPRPADNGKTSQYASADPAGSPPHVPDLLTPRWGSIFFANRAQLWLRRDICSAAFPLSKRGLAVLAGPIMGVTKKPGRSAGLSQFCRCTNA